jgi:hypothetical protein
MIGSNRPPYGSECEPRSGIDPLAICERGGGRLPRGGSSRKFLRHHAAGFGFGRGPAGCDLGEAQLDDALRFKSKRPCVDPQFPPGKHVFRPAAIRSNYRHQFSNCD